MPEEPAINHWWHLRRAGASPYFLATVLTLLLSSGLSVSTCSWVWMQRCGGVVVLFGVLLGFPRLLRLGPQRAIQDDAPLVVDGNRLNMEGLWQSVQRLTDSYAQALGLGFVILGTLLAGYGDVVLEFLWPLAGPCRG